MLNSHDFQCLPLSDHPWGRPSGLLRGKSWEAELPTCRYPSPPPESIGQCPQGQGPLPVRAVCLQC